MAHLQFQKMYSREGFTEAIISSSQSTPEPVVRELLQNSLDAFLAHQNSASGSSSAAAEVVFTITECPTSEIPGFDEYMQAFSSAKQTRGKGKQGADEKRIIRLIDEVLAKDKVRVLFCRDNGIGLDDGRMTSLLWSGNTDKQGTQAGAFGLGHKFAFQASNLRYVLYAGRSQNDVGTAEIFGGHARLAAHHSSSDDESKSEDGFFVETLPRNITELPTYSTEVPPLLASQLSQVGPAQNSTGTVVCMLGFNDFDGEEPDNTAAEILRAAAKNFFAAIHSGRMTVTVIDETQSSNIQLTLDQGNLDGLMHQLDTEKRSKRQGFLAGAKAFEAYQTLKHGTVIEVADAEIAIRPTEISGHFKRYEISLCRNGMWITRDIPECQPSDFARTQPFNAVILLNKEGKLHSLIRKTEGPEHRNIDKQKLGRQEKDLLKILLDMVADAIRKEVGEVKEDEVFRPKGFAMINPVGERLASPRNGIKPPGPDGDKKSTGRKGTKKRKKPKTPSTERPPRPGAALAIHSSMRARSQKDGTVNEILANCSFASQDVASKYMAVRIYQPSGSDESCEAPVSSQYVKLKGIQIQGDEGGEEYPPSKGGLEVVIPATTSNLAITLKERHSLESTTNFKLQLFKRKKLEAAETQDDQPAN